MGTRSAKPRRRLALAVSGLAALVMAAAGCASPSSSAGPAPSGSGSARPNAHRSPAPPVPRGLRPFTRGLLLGAFAGGDGLVTFDQQVGQAALAVTYVHWGTPVTYLASLINSAARQGAEAILEFEPGAYGHDAAQVAAGYGGSDAWLRQVGQMVAEVGKPVAVSFFPEMNGPWHKGWSEGPASYIRAYRHVHHVLYQLAGPLITWFWQCSAIHKNTPSPRPWWPGRRYVDVAAMDSYYYYKHDTFDAVFGATIKLIRRVSPRVPIMIGETAAGPLFGRQAWEIANIFTGIHKNGLIGLVWFNQYQHKPPYQFHQDWRLQDHPKALAAFRHGLAEYGPLAELRT